MGLQATSRPKRPPETEKIGDLPRGEEKLAVPTALQDPAFERFVDVRLISTAICTLNAALLTDTALQLAEGERVLLRSHKMLSTKEIIDAAVRLASQKHDKASLERLAKFAMLTKNGELSKQVKTNLDLILASRAAPALMIPVDTKPEQLAVYKGLITTLEAAVLCGDAKGVGEVAEDVKKLEKGALPDKLTADLEKRVQEAETTVKSITPTETQKALTMLEGASRVHWSVYRRRHPHHPWTWDSNHHMHHHAEERASPPPRGLGCLHPASSPLIR